MSAAGLDIRATTLFGGICRRYWRAMWIGLLLGTMCFPSGSTAEEPARPFLDALLAQGYHDTAIDYLEFLEKQSLVPETMRGAIDYERANVLISWSSAPGDLQQRLSRLDQAVSLIEKFLQDQPQNPRMEEARGRLCDILFGRANLELTLAARDRTDGGKASHRATAIKLFAQAHRAYAERVEMSLNAYKALRDTPAETRDGQRYKTLRDEIESAMFMSARTQYEWAVALRTEPNVDLKKSDELLGTARKEFLSFAEKFRKHLRGVLAIYYAGRCHQLQGELDDAISLYEEIRAADPSQQALRELLTNTTTALMEIWLTEKKNDPNRAVELGDAWAKELVGDELESTYGLEFQWTFARALDVAMAKAKGTPREVLASRRRKLLNVVANSPNVRQAEARKLLAEARPAKTTSANDTPTTPTNFAEIKVALKAAREELASTRLIVELLEPKLQDAPAERRKEMEQQLAQARTEIARQSEQAKELAQSALETATKDTPPEELTEIKQFMAITAYEAKDYLMAAVLSEHVARYQPSSPHARSMARIALASYQRLYLDASENDRQFEQDQILAVADYVAKAWPGEPESLDATLILVQLYTQQGNVELAKGALERLPKENAKRADAEIAIGVRLWRQYLVGKQQQREANSADATNPPAKIADDATLEPLKQEALKTLEQAVEARKEGQVDLALVNGVLALSEIFVDTNQSSKAVTLLEDARFGPKTLADANSELMNGLGVADRTYRVSLRAYIATLPTAPNKQAQLEKTTKAMQALDARAGATAEGRAQLAAIYKSLAQDLRQQLVLAPPSTQEELAQGFDAFLDNVLKNSNEFALLFWIAETYAELGGSFDTKSTPLPPNATKYYQKALDTYNAILALKRENKIALEDQAVPALRIRAASVARQLGKFEEAFAVFEELLRENNMLLNVQVEAAEALQAAGAKTGKIDLLEQAINGRGQSADGQQSTVWGWGKLSKICQAQMTRSDENRQRFGPIFYSARYNLVRCRYEQAKLAEGEARKKYLDIIKRGVTSLVGSYPELGGTESYEKFDRLMKQVQKDLGEEITGVKGLTK